MAGGKRFKFQGSKFAISSDFRADSPSSTISAITRANPAVVTENSHGRQTGAIVKIRGAGGMEELNEEIFVINVLTNNTYELFGVDSTGYNPYTPNSAKVDEATFTNFCELTGYNRQGGSKPEIDATSACSTAAEYELGLQDFGTLQLDYFFAPQTVIQQAVADFNASGDKLGVRIELPKSGGKRVLFGFMQQVSEQVAVNGLWTGSLTIRLTGEPFDYV